VDLTPCDACTVSTAGACGLKASALECATCCESRARVADYAPFFEACACGSAGPCAASCKTSTLCGGAGPETAECAKCSRQTLVDGGSCIASAAFRSSCLHGTDTGCALLAQCLATCPAE
jgi:hypothetical protein